MCSSSCQRVQSIKAAFSERDVLDPYIQYMTHGELKDDF